MICRSKKVFHFFLALYLFLVLSLNPTKQRDMDIQMSYPHETVAPSIYTDFVNGVKFDICEVDKSCYHMLTSKKFRFFLCVEDNHICFYESAEQYFEKTGDVRWGFFCKTKAECIDLINQFSDAYDSIEKWLERAERTPALKRSSMEKVNSIRSRMMTIFGTYP